jgi:hypothetical protein
MQKDINTNELTLQHLIELLESVERIDSCNRAQIEAELSRIVTFRDTHKFCIYYPISQSSNHLDYLTWEDEIQKKMAKKKRGWDEYNNEVSNLVDLFNEAYTYVGSFRRLMHKHGSGRFENDNPFSRPALFFLEFVAVIDFMLYSLLTNPKAYFEIISNEPQQMSA